MGKSYNSISARNLAKKYKLKLKDIITNRPDGKVTINDIKIHLMNNTVKTPTPTYKPNPSPKILIPRKIPEVKYNLQNKINRYENQINTGINIPNKGQIIYLPENDKFLIKINKRGRTTYKKIFQEYNGFFIREGSYSDEKFVKLPNSIAIRLNYIKNNF